MRDQLDGVLNAVQRGQGQGQPVVRAPQQAQPAQRGNPQVAPHPQPSAAQAPPQGAPANAADLSVNHGIGDMSFV